MWAVGRPQPVERVASAKGSGAHGTPANMKELTVCGTNSSSEKELGEGLIPEENNRSFANQRTSL